MKKVKYHQQFDEDLYDFALRGNIRFDKQLLCMGYHLLSKVVSQVEFAQEASSK